MTEESQAMRELTKHAEPCVLCFPAVLTVTEGQSHPHVLLAQAMLQALGQDFPELSGVTVTGCLDAATSRALLTIQRCAGLPETGDLDKQTWNRLCRLYRAMFDRFHAPSQG